MGGMTDGAMMVGELFFSIRQTVHWFAKSNAMGNKNYFETRVLLIPSIFAIWSRGFNSFSAIHVPPPPFSLPSLSLSAQKIKISGLEFRPLPSPTLGPALILLGREGGREGDQGDAASNAPFSVYPFLVDLGWRAYRSLLSSHARKWDTCVYMYTCTYSIYIRVMYPGEFQRRWNPRLRGQRGL